MAFFTIYEYWWFYLAFIAFVFVLLSLDLGVFHKKAHAVSVKEATAWTAVWISLALVFNIIFYFYALHALQAYPRADLQPYDPQIMAKKFALEFLTGFLIEKALAIDNIFVFAVVFNYFSIPLKYQHRVLFWGIFGALIFRGIFIAIGSKLMAYHSVVIFFGVLLIITGLKIIFVRETSKDLSQNFLLRMMNKFLNLTPKLEGDHFYQIYNGKLFLTPLFVALIFIEMSDIVFAIDSVPAIFAITKEPLIVFTSNVFAILGLRSMYFMLSGAVEKFRYIKYGLAGILVFVGLKMVYLNEYFHGHFPIWLSLTIISTMLLVSILASIFLDKKPISST